MSRKRGAMSIDVDKVLAFTRKELGKNSIYDLADAYELKRTWSGDINHRNDAVTHQCATALAEMYMAAKPDDYIGDAAALRAMAIAEWSKTLYEKFGRNLTWDPSKPRRPRREGSKDLCPPQPVGLTIVSPGQVAPSKEQEQ